MPLQLPTRERLRELSKERPSPAMIQEVIRALVTKILQDKILLGLVILGILAVFVLPSMNDKEGPQGHHGMAAPPPEAAQAVGQGEGAQGAMAGGEAGAGAPAPAAQPPAANPNAVDPKLADEFVRFWMNGAMDYNAQSAVESHKKAFAWMSPESQATFETNFWSPDIANAIATGQLQGAFQPISVQPQAINPDGSVVVTMTGTLVLQQASVRPVTHQIIMDVLVRKENDSLRIGGLYNRSYPVAR